MRLKIFPWLGQEFVSLSWENASAGTVEEETRAIFELFSKQLKQLDLSLDHGLGSVGDARGNRQPAQETAVTAHDSCRQLCAPDVQPQDGPCVRLGPDQIGRVVGPARRCGHGRVFDTARSERQALGKPRTRQSYPLPQEKQAPTLRVRPDCLRGGCVRAQHADHLALAS